MFGFSKGIRLESNKAEPLTREIAELPVPERLLVPLPGCTKEDFLVKPGAAVKAGAVIASPSGNAPVHAPAAGVVAGYCTIKHPLLGKVDCAVLDVDMPAQKAEAEKSQKISGGTLTVAGAAGILDEFDGAPLYRTLKRFRTNQRDVLVCCAADDDPYTAANAAVLREHGEDVLAGLLLAAKYCGVQDVKVLVENREEAAHLSAAHPDVQVLVAGQHYPARALLKQKLFRQGKKSGFIGAQACLALARAVNHGAAQDDTVVTVAGDCVREPQNIRVPIGTPARAVLNYCVLEHTPAGLLFGSSVTGRAIPDLDMPVSANTRCILAVRRLPRHHSFACIGCGRCMRVCPRGIAPWRVRAQLVQNKVDPIQLTNVQNCIACGACNMACPSGVDLTTLVLQAATLKESGDF